MRTGASSAGSSPRTTSATSSNNPSSTNGSSRSARDERAWVMPLRVQELLDRAGESITVGRAFGTAYEQDGVLVIPVAWVAGGAGAGAADGDSPGSGEGGGYGAVAWPLGV